MKRGRKAKPELSPEVAACQRLTNDGASSNEAVRRRIGLIAAERKLDPSETKALMKGRCLTLRNLGQFAEKHQLRLDWMIGGAIKAYPRGSSARHMANPRPRARSDHNFVEAMA